MESRQPRSAIRDAVRNPMTLLQLAAVAVLLWTWRNVERHPFTNDAYTYWNAWRGGLYDLPWLAHGAYVYSPATAQAIWPWTQLSWHVAWIVESGAQLAALALIAGPLLAVVLFYLPIGLPFGEPNPIAATIGNGNIQILIALAIVASYRWPATWAFVLHTKITPGVGMLWYVVRREWRNLAIALGVTVAIALVSFALAPALWFQWFDLLRGAGSANTLLKEPVLSLPLYVRLPIAMVLIAWGARTNRFWTVPIGAMLSLGAIQLGGFAVAVGAVPFIVGRAPRLRFLMPEPLLLLWGIGSTSPQREPEHAAR